jgi:molecular chaperone GrpE (heat shock protein)
MKEKRRSDNSLSAINKFIAELNDEEHPPASESDSESSIESDEIAWDESQTSSTQSSEAEYHSPIDARTRSTRRSSTASEQRPTNDLLSSLLGFMDDLNESEA